MVWAGDNIHTILDIGGMVPGVGEFLDGVNALLYLAEGDYVNAAFSAAALIPFAGAGVALGKYAVKYGDEAVGGIKTLLKSDLLQKQVKKLSNKGGYIDLGAFTKGGSEVASKTGKDIISQAKRYTPDQQALIELAKDVKKNGGATLDEANTLLKWADEYNVPAHGPEIHPERPGAASNILHFHIGKTGHITIK